METQVRTPQSVFMLPQRFLVPLFQRPYVWNQENQWEPLWEDLTRAADRLLRSPQAKHPPHFLGAVVLQQSPNPVGQMQARTIIDGQQRLTTLQLLLDALHAELLGVQAATPAARIQPLIENASAFCGHPEDRFKVWPTNRDRAAFGGPTEAASVITGKRTNGWDFFMVDSQSRRTLRKVKTEYRDSLMEDVEIDDGEDEEDGGED